MSLHMAVVYSCINVSYPYYHKTGDFLFQKYLHDQPSDSSPYQTCILWQHAGSSHVPQTLAVQLTEGHCSLKCNFCTVIKGNRPFSFKLMQDKLNIQNEHIRQRNISSSIRKRELPAPRQSSILSIKIQAKPDIMEQPFQKQFLTGFFQSHRTNLSTNLYSYLNQLNKL